MGKKCSESVKPELQCSFEITGLEGNHLEVSGMQEMAIVMHCAVEEQEGYIGS